MGPIGEDRLKTGVQSVHNPPKKGSKVVKNPFMKNDPFVRSKPSIPKSMKPRGQTFAKGGRHQNHGQMYVQKCAQKEEAQIAFHPRGLSANRFWSGIFQSAQNPTWRLATLIKSRILFNLSRTEKEGKNRPKKGD
jgi:hypothetical protein